MNMLSSLVAATKQKGEKMYYYAGTRARAMSARLIPDEQYLKFLKMEVYEIIKYLEEHEYKKEIDELGVTHSNVDLAERGISQNMANVVNTVLRIVPRGSPLVEYVRRYDIQNLKTILRGKHSREAEETILKQIIPAGSFNKEFLGALIECETVERVLKQLDNTPYKLVLQDCNKDRLDEIEDALDRFYYGYVLEVAKEYQGLINFIKHEIDVKNVVILFRLKKRGVKDIEKYFIVGGSISKNTLKVLYGKNEIEIIDALSNGPLWRYVPTETKELGKIEAGLRKYLMLYGKKLLRDYNPTFETVLGYLIAKEKEVVNLRIVLMSKKAKTPESAVAIRDKLFIRE